MWRNEVVIDPPHNSKHLKKLLILLTKKTNALSSYSPHSFQMHTPTNSIYNQHNQNNWRNTYWRTTEYVGCVVLRILEFQMQKLKLFSSNPDHKARCCSAYSTPSSQTQLLEGIQKSGQALIVLQWTTLISAAAKAGDTNRCMDLFRKMERQGIKPNEVTWTTLISSFAKAEKH